MCLTLTKNSPAVSTANIITLCVIFLVFACSITFSSLVIKTGFRPVAAFELTVETNACRRQSLLNVVFDLLDSSREAIEVKFALELAFADLNVRERPCTAFGFVNLAVVIRQ